MNGSCQTTASQDQQRQQENRQPRTCQTGIRPLYQKDPFGRLFTRRRSAGSPKPKNPHMDELRKTLLNRRALREEAAKQQMEEMRKMNSLVYVAPTWAPTSPFQLMKAPTSATIRQPSPEAMNKLPALKIKEPLPLTPWALHAFWKKTERLVEDPMNVTARVEVLEAVEALASIMTPS